MDENSKTKDKLKNTMIKYGYKSYQSSQNLDKNILLNKLNSMNYDYNTFKDSISD